MQKATPIPLTPSGTSFLLARAAVSSPASFASRFCLFVTDFPASQHLAKLARKERANIQSGASADVSDNAPAATAATASKAKGRGKAKASKAVKAENEDEAGGKRKRAAPRKKATKKEEEDEDDGEADIKLESLPAAKRSKPVMFRPE
jgi:hypothetical protein